MFKLSYQLIELAIFKKFELRGQLKKMLWYLKGQFIGDNIYKYIFMYIYIKIYIYIYLYTHL
jgi:hypothetical protein